MHEWLMVVSAIVTFLVSSRLWRQSGLPPASLRALAILALSAGILCSRAITELLRVLVPGSIILPSGHSMFGGLAGATMCIWCATRYWRIDGGKALGVLFTALPVGLAIGRIACFSACCCFGVVLGVPVQLVSAACDLALFALLLVLLRRFGPLASNFFLFLACYGMKRLVLGFCRDDAPRDSLGLSVFQYLGALVAIAGLSGLLFWRLSRATHEVKAR
ncbi:MAG: prolipoprotein diacylglyceryl transferase [Planctomycetes bacterium]|nr:prolipoprotein diacylglyceryl transferase [Planctomycetota bacterium]